MTSPTASLEVVDLEVQRSNFRLGPLSFAIRDGETLTVLGPNGAGKSTLLQALAGLLPPRHGAIRHDGQDLGDVPVHRRGFAMVFQDPGLLPHRSVERNVAYPLELRGWSRRETQARVDELLDRFHISPLRDRAPATVSGGEAQRVALARALAPHPRALFLDEPLASVDPPHRKEFQVDLKASLREENVAVVHVTHDLNEGAFLADRLAVLIAGKWRQGGPVPQVLDRPHDAVTARFLGYNLVRGPSGWLAVHPEDVVLDTEGKRSEGSVPVVVVASGYSETGVQLFLRSLVPTDSRPECRGIPPDGLLEARWGTREALLASGERVWVRFRRALPVAPPIGPQEEALLNR
jgi:thiamine transport system ATP-binding protein